jgi:thiosulfate/3-mercaptopyruvate sulfurtransferase
MYSTLISVEQLQALQASGQPLMVFDCSFELMNPAAGPKAYAEVHVAGSVYANLDTALSTHNPADAASGGRHPLPSRETFAAWLGSVGFANHMQAVVLDRNGANYCGRLWWMLKWLGHEAVAVLDGGHQAWASAGGAMESGAGPAYPATTFEIKPAVATLVTPEAILKNIGNASQTVLDARAAPRYRGEVEPLDPVAGHIPGALNRAFSANLGPDGKFKPADVLRAEFLALLGTRDPATVVHQCGSGVSANPNLIAMEIAGLGRTGLYAGSWSDWCSDPSRPVAQG